MGKRHDSKYHFPTSHEGISYTKNIVQSKRETSEKLQANIQSEIITIIGPDHAPLLKTWN